MKHVALRVYHYIFISQVGGPFYPVFTGRRDSNQSYYHEVIADIPKPDGNITETLRLFGLKGFVEKETVSLLGIYLHFLYPYPLSLSLNIVPAK